MKKTRKYTLNFCFSFLIILENGVYQDHSYFLVICQFIEDVDYRLWTRTLLAAKTLGWRKSLL